MSMSLHAMFDSSTSSFRRQCAGSLCLEVRSLLVPEVCSKQVSSNSSTADEDKLPTPFAEYLFDLLDHDRRQVSCSNKILHFGWSLACPCLHSTK